MTGFYDPIGKWHPDQDFPSSREAADRVHWLNGGSKKDLDDHGNAITELASWVRRLVMVNKLKDVEQ